MDPIEVGGRRIAPGKGRTEAQPSILAAVKPNIGLFLEGSAGMTRVSEVILTMQQVQRPPEPFTGRLARTVAPMAVGGWNLHVGAEASKPGICVLLSPASATVGLVDMAAAADAPLGGLALWRRGRLGDLSLAWDPGPEAGMAAAAGSDGYLGGRGAPGTPARTGGQCSSAAAGAAGPQCSSNR